jgi:hypothetical protein
MAVSPSHKFGQIIGDLVEGAVLPLLLDFAKNHGLFLDRKGPRPARSGRKVSWLDRFGNEHDLDYVLERGGTQKKMGRPVAFIESAWRRYTKHSRNKAQEIQGAILPLAETHTEEAPFIGVILAGVFTEGALSQLRSLGFSVLFLPYETVVEAFSIVGIDATFDEDTADKVFARKVRAWERLSRGKQATVARKLLDLNAADVDRFVRELEAAVTRRVQLVRVLPLHGAPREYSTVEEAMEFVRRYDESPGTLPIVLYEIDVRYTNGDRVEGRFKDRRTALAFLAKHVAP